MHINRRVFNVSITSRTYPIYETRIDITSHMSLHYWILQFNAAQTVDCNLYIPLSEWIIRANSARLLTFLIACNLNINTDCGSMIRLAATTKYVRMVDILIQAGADINLCGSYQTALRRAIEYSSSDMVSKLLRAGASITAEGLPTTSSIPNNDIIFIRECARYSKVDSQAKIALLENYFNKRAL